MKAVQPHEYNEKILIGVTGLSPQVVTETLFALICQRKPAFIPTQIHLITTQEGSDRIQLTLLDPQQGKFFEFCQDYSLSSENIKFDQQTIHILPDAQGMPLQDIRSDSDNELMANMMVNLVRQLTSNPDSAIHVSIAGGRKTMGFYLGYAISLYGREQDRLSHILVSEAFENNNEFYYPPPQPKVMFTRDNKPVRTDQAVITLANIPFVRMRNGIPQPLLQGNASFVDAVNVIQKQFAPLNLKIDNNMAIMASGQKITMKPVEQAFYLWMIWRRLKQQPNIHHTKVDPTEYLDIYKKLPNNKTGNLERVEQSLQNGMTKEFFEQRKSRANSALTNVLGNQADDYLIKPSGKRPVTQFGVMLDSTLITWEDWNK